MTTVSLFWDTNISIETVLKMLPQVNKQEIKDFHKRMFFYNAFNLGNNVTENVIVPLSSRLNDYRA